LHTGTYIKQHITPKQFKRCTPKGGSKKTRLSQLNTYKNQHITPKQFTRCTPKVASKKHDIIANYSFEILKKGD